MATKKIAFIEAGASGFQMLSKYHVARIGTVLLSTILRDRGYAVKVFIEDIAPLDWAFVKKCDLVCISTLTSTAMRAYEIADRVTAKGIPVVMGGAHPTFMPEEALIHADYVIRGEGDHALPELIDHIEQGRPDIETIGGLSYTNSDGTIRHNPPRPYLEEQDLERLPEPDFSLVHKWKSSIIYPVATSRGCPFDCKFCSVVHLFGRKYRFKSIESTLKGLQYVHSVSHATKFFVDDNFTANKQRTKELLRGMIAQGITSSWAAQVRTDVARDTELLRLMADAGCHTLYIGFESINPKTLEAYNKKQVVDDIINCVKIIKGHGLHIHGMFVLGADTDDVDTIKKTADFAIKIGIDTTQLAPLTPLPGTPVFEEMQESGRLLHRDWSKYNLQHVVFRPKLMSPQTLQVESLKGMGRFYSWRYILGHLRRLDFHYTAVGLFGKKIVRNTQHEVSRYLTQMR